MGEHPIRLDPAASFDAEVARLGDEHNADVAFRLVEREDPPMVQPTCQLHDETQPPRPERFEFTITEKGSPEKLITCKDHGQWVYEQAHGRDPKPKAPEQSNRACR